ncbi:MAG: hypothetical protein R3A51_14585 [Nannocystaceae bacterium]|nr:hypothetical protein [Myxococcales bacterium]
MLTRTRLSRCRSILGALGLVLALGGACKDRSTIPPEDGGKNPGAAAGAKNAAGITVRYKIGAQKLRKDVKGTMRITSTQGGATITADLSGTLDITDNGDGNLKVAFAVSDVREFKTEGGPPPKEGTPDPKEQLKGATGAFVVNDRGEEDEAKSGALPENANKDEQDPSAQAAGLLSLPELPELALEVGKPIKKEEQKDVPSPAGIKIPTDFELTYTLLSVDESAGARIATIKIETDGSGAVEHPQAGMIDMSVSGEQTVKFNLDTQLPISASVQNTSSINFGTQGSAEFALQFDSTFSAT